MLVQIVALVGFDYTKIWPMYNSNVLDIKLYKYWLGSSPILQNNLRRGEVDVDRQGVRLVIEFSLHALPPPQFIPGRPRPTQCDAIHSM